MPLSVGQKQNFNTLRRAFRTGDAALMECQSAASDENKLLHFYDCEAAYGEFQELEGWLREYKIPFRRHSSGKYEIPPRDDRVPAGSRQRGRGSLLLDHR